MDGWTETETETELKTDRDRRLLTGGREFKSSAKQKKAFWASPWNEDKDASDVVLRSRRVIVSLLRV